MFVSPTYCSFLLIVLSCIPALSVTVHLITTSSNHGHTKQPIYCFKKSFPHSAHCYCTTRQKDPDRAWWKLKQIQKPRTSSQSLKLPVDVLSGGKEPKMENKQACNSLMQWCCKLPTVCLQGKCVIYKHRHVVKCQDASQCASLFVINTWSFSSLPCGWPSSHN